VASEMTPSTFEMTEVIGNPVTIDSTTEMTEGRLEGRPDPATELTSLATLEMIELITEMTVAGGTSETIAVASETMLSTSDTSDDTGTFVMIDCPTEITEDNCDAPTELASDTTSEMIDCTTEMTVGAGTSDATPVASETMLSRFEARDVSGKPVTIDCTTEITEGSSIDWRGSV